MSHNQHQSGSSNSNIPVSEVYWALVAKADKKFSKIRDLPYYQRTRYDTYFYKVFKVYTQLWKFQQENRQKLVDAGLKRWEIGEIASRIGQLYFGQYMRTSEVNYLSESYVFYEAILTREYFKDGLHQDITLASKQLRFIARFLTVCLVLNRREVVFQLVNQLKMLLDECKRTFQVIFSINILDMRCILPGTAQIQGRILSCGELCEIDFKEWKLVIQEIVKFLKVDTAFMNNRPLRYSVVLDLQPDSLPNVLEAKKNLKLRDALLCSYHPNEVKFSELTLDTFRMLQCLEWEPGGSFYLPSIATSTGSGSGTGQNGALGPSRVNKDITDPTLPPNPRKAILYRPSVTHFIAVLGTVCEELPTDGILLIYLSTSENSTYSISSATHAGSTGYSENISRGFQFHSTNFEPISSRHPSTGLDHPGRDADCLHIGPRGLGGVNCLYPSDILPFTRRPLFLVIDSENSEAFKAMSGSEKGESVAMLLSPSISLRLPSVESSRQHSGSLFTSFLTAPLQSLVLLLGINGSDIEKDLYSKAEKLLQSSSNEWESLLAASDNLDPVWSRILSDPFLKRLLLRFVFCRAVLFLYSQSSNKIEFVPECMPRLPEVVSPMSSACRALVAQLADIFGAMDRFIFPVTTIPSYD